MHYQFIGKQFIESTSIFISWKEFCDDVEVASLGLYHIPPWRQENHVISNVSFSSFISVTTGTNTSIKYVAFQEEYQH